MWSPARVVLLVAVTGVAALPPRGAHAHFLLHSPASWREQNALGDPQKMGPCGDEGTAATTGAVTNYAPGATVTIMLDETIFHPGHYRVALAVNDRSELPPEPPVTPGATDCGSVPIMDPPVFPVLADGMLLHDAPFSGAQTFEVTLPADVTCEKCTLQVLEFMSNHGAPCFYHHCADLALGPPPTSCTTDLECDDADTCTTDTCDEVTGCRHVPLGLAQVGVGFLGTLDAPACADDRVPGVIGRLFTRGETLVERAAKKPAKATRLLRRATKKLDKAAAKAARAATKELSAPCGSALAARVDEARGRLGCLASALANAGPPNWPPRSAP